MMKSVFLRRLTLLVFACLLGTGCASPELLREYFEPEKGGILKFQSGARPAALKKGQEFCRGPIRILKEGSEFTENEVDGVSSMSVQGQADTGLVFLQFRCAVQGRK